MLRTKVGVRRRWAGDRGVCGVAVVQDNDAVVPQVAQGVLYVAHGLPMGVEPVDQGDVDAVLLEEGRLVREEGIAGRLEVVRRRAPPTTRSTRTRAGKRCRTPLYQLRRQPIPVESDVDDHLERLGRPHRHRCHRVACGPLSTSPAVAKAAFQSCKTAGLSTGISMARRS
jgi:hypothetical protein